MKRKTTKEILAESIRELSAQKAMDKITIDEITDNGIHRRSFIAGLKVNAI
ncbi:hypothetical protein HMP0721_1349 [Pseudoramibacter alactolyticus ATCC 23263]|uniref:Uncharacterized protein n=1 Tax=Pseudoramibacter alactolyticus ATCC 23263 TaxID=887929 RepID=E6MH64_9FIRM|nr:hypothetical protein [Pseudoramibacter alactolyticus]EFV01954.1 hypothetical protein HMP0721_1349 [Pseudoramibacter alactolyticus ATCC 23263]